jgi:hypothetical protein
MVMVVVVRLQAQCLVISNRQRTAVFFSQSNSGSSLGL